MSKAAFVVCPRQQRESRFDLAVVAERKGFLQESV